MGPLPLFGLAAQHAKWLSVRQAAVSQNLANVNTPGFRALDVRPFQDVLQRVQTDLATTNAGHITASPLSASAAALKQADGSDVTASGNSVGLEQELLKAGEINRNYAMDSGVVKAFHRMLLASVKGGA
jgi:flagellar basal-body rod protein FlgB